MPEPLSPKSGFGMNVAVLPLRARHVLDDVLEPQELIGGEHHGREAHVDLALPGGGDLVVLDLDVEAELLQGHAHLGAQVDQRVGRRHREVAALVAGL